MTAPIRPDWPCHPFRFSPTEQDAIVAAIAAGEPIKAVALRLGAPYKTVHDVLYRRGISPKATDDPAVLARRERWRRNTAACRIRRGDDVATRS